MCGKINAEVLQLYYFLIFDEMRTAKTSEVLKNSEV